MYLVCVLVIMYLYCYVSICLIVKLVDYIIFLIFNLFFYWNILYLSIGMLLSLYEIIRVYVMFFFIID